ncbi:FAD-binding oxidoreductase [Sporolactobacillus sp. THM7-7]|nr:FAD-binding oxidoreductase [Sporolactobacillus sp. THM7-7]
MEKIVVIGGGITGITAAYTLAKAGRRVTVIDRLDAGQATDAAAGIICPWLSKRRNRKWYALAKNGARFYERLVHDLSRDIATETGYKKVGALAVRKSSAALDELAEKALERRKEAPEIGEVEALTSEEAKKRFPLIGEGFGGVYVSGGARVDGRALRTALEKGAGRYGAEYRRDSAALHTIADRVDGVVCRSSGTYIRADHIILAAGAWVKSILESVGLTADVSPQKGQLLHVRLRHGQTDRWPVLLPPGAHDIVPFDRGRLVIGSTHEAPENGFDLRPTVGGVAEVLTEALKIAPEIGDATITDIRVGTRPYTSDFSPFIGRVPGQSSLWAVNGLGSSGLTSGPFAGWLLAKEVLGEKVAFSLEPYDPAKHIYTA